MKSWPGLVEKMIELGLSDEKLKKIIFFFPWLRKNCRETLGQLCWPTLCLSEGTLHVPVFAVFCVQKRILFRKDRKISDQIPNSPVCNDIVDEGCPQEDKDHCWNQSRSFRNRAEDQGGSDSGELHLVHHEGDRRNLWRRVGESVSSQASNHKKSTHPIHQNSTKEM
jgi:hypothetical protein